MGPGGSGGPQPGTTPSLQMETFPYFIAVLHSAQKSTAKHSWAQGRTQVGARQDAASSVVLMFLVAWREVICYKKGFL